MAWPGIPSASTISGISSSSQDMKLYELSERLRSMQIVQAEQSRRLDEQSYRLYQLEMKDLQTNRIESQRCLWGAVGSGSGNNQTPPLSKTLTGLAFEVFSPSKDKEEGQIIIKSGPFPMRRIRT